jgi:hypothetical protein
LALATTDREIDVRSDHFDESQIAAFVDGELSEAERRRLQAHVEQCATCRAALIDVMRTVDSFVGVSGLAVAKTGEPTYKASTGRRTRVIGALTAAGVIAVALLLPPAGRRSARERSGSNPTELSADALPTIEIVAPRNNDTLPAHAPRFRWRTVPGIELYHVVILQEGGATVWSGDARGVSEVTADSVTLAPGKVYFWHVNGIRDGVAATSRAHRFLAK